jgi:hypothetical protein
VEYGQDRAMQQQLHEIHGQDRADIVVTPKIHSQGNTKESKQYTH